MVASTLPSTRSGLYADPNVSWLAQHTEPVLDPARPIIDPHHHLWDRGGVRYMMEEMTDDIAMGHNIIATVYVEARSFYRASGRKRFAPSARSSSSTASRRWRRAALTARRWSATASSVTPI